MSYPALDDKVSVAPQITPSDVPSLAESGFRTVICNRPDGEVPPEMSADTIRVACEEAGLAFVDNPLSHGNLTLEIVDRQREAIAASDGPVFAYCASGNRCTILWSLVQAQSGTRSTADILASARRAGYSIDGLAPQLDALIAARD